MKSWLAPIVVCSAAAVGLAQPAFSQGFAALGVRLQQGMTEPQVVTAIGELPDATSLSTCGAKTGHPWKCKSYTYGPGADLSQLYVLFEYRSGVGWVVNKWSATPESDALATRSLGPSNVMS